MPQVPIHDQRGRRLESVSATMAKNGFGRVLDRALAVGAVAITKRDRVHAVVLSVEAYEALVQPGAESLVTLESEFDDLLATIRTPRARAAGEALFAATPAALGRAALKAARTRA